VTTLYCIKTTDMTVKLFINNKKQKTKNGDHDKQRNK